MSPEEAISRMAKLEALTPELFAALDRVAKFAGTTPTILRMAMMPGATKAQKRLAMSQIRNGSDDFLRAGALMRRQCDLIEPMYEDGE